MNFHESIFSKIETDLIALLCCCHWGCYFLLLQHDYLGCSLLVQKTVLETPKQSQKFHTVNVFPTAKAEFNYKHYNFA